MRLTKRKKIIEELGGLWKTEGNMDQIFVIKMSEEKY